MIFYLIGSEHIKILTFVSVIFAFVLTCAAIKFGKNTLPRDAGRAYAINGTKSVGKPRGAGIIFILAFTLSSVLFIPMNAELIIYLILILAAMLSGYLDDSAKTPWGNLKKGLIDFAIAIMGAITYLHYNQNTFELAFSNKVVTLHPIIYGILIVILIWASINVTNCSDGVDGLCGTLAVVTLMSAYVLFKNYEIESYFRHMLLLMIVCILGYLWFNASPSRILMGDAGSRAIGLFIAFTFLKLHRPLLFIPMALMLILDGGLGLFKVSCMRFLHLKPMQNIRTPIHDHMRKNLDWSDPQVVFRFSIIQAVICIAVIFLAI
jgi:phospho-N-acetylmuramoyl-pentapeptide-transferase